MRDRRRGGGLAAVAALLVMGAAVLAGGCAPSADRTSPAVSSSVAAPASPTAPSPRTQPSCAPAAETDLPWWNDRVFYEVFVRSFQDSDGDGIGDLRGLTDRLDELNDGDPATTTDLGVTGLWLMPIAEAASYHGYDVTDYRAVERDYGTADDFRALVAAAHERGIAVIVDLVLNHTSREHPWFEDSRTPGSVHADWYRWADSDPGYAGPNGQQVWHRDGDRWYYAQFWEGMPDLNLENPEVTAELEAIAGYWLDLGADGFRLDAVKHLLETGTQQTNTPASHAWLEAFRARLRSAHPDALLVGEIWDLTLVSSSYVPDAVDLAFDFELAGKMILGAKIGDAGTVAAAQRDVLRRYPAHQYAAFLTNHDQTRVASELDEPGARRVAASLLLTNPGVPFVYYGEEIGLTGAKPDERIRTPMAWDGTSPAAGFTSGTPWEPLEDGWETRNVAAQRSDPSSLLAHYRSMIALRARHPALRAGDVVQIETGSTPLYAFLAARGADRVLVVANLGDQPVSDYALALPTADVCGSAVGRVLYTDGLAGPPSIAPIPTPATEAVDWQPVSSLPAHATLVLALEP